MSRGELEVCPEVSWRRVGGVSRGEFKGELEVCPEVSWRCVQRRVGGVSRGEFKGELEVCPEESSEESSKVSWRCVQKLFLLTVQVGDHLNIPEGVIDQIAQLIDEGVIGDKLHTIINIS